MNNPPLVCVVDANVALKLFFVQPGSDLADALFAHLDADAQTQFYVPDFFFAECASAFANYVRLLKYPASDAKQDMVELKDLALSIVPTVDLVTDALEIATTYGISGYDACYVALSHQANAPLVTADEKLVRAMASTPYNVQSLATFAIPPLS